MHKRLATALLVLLPVAASAQSGGGDGYLFKRPVGSVSIRAGATRPNASGGVFDFASNLLMPRGSTNTSAGLSPSDYTSFASSIEASFGLTNRSELVLGAAFSRRRVDSEYRAWVDNNDKPIEQLTRLTRTPVTVGLKWNLVPSGRAISRLVWVPNRFVPYVAAGGGAMWWRFRQEGDFVDFQSNTLDVFKSTLQDKGWAPTAYGAAGASWLLHPALSLNAEVRYDAASAPLRGDFDGFKRIGLSGVGVSAGVQLRY
jgi:hypothetical protein